MIANGLLIVLASLQSTASVPKEEIATLRRALASMDSFDGALSKEQAARINARYALDLRRVTGRAVRELLDQSGSEAERVSCLSYFGRQKADAIGGVYLARLAQGDRQRRVRDAAAYTLRFASREGTLTKDLPGVSRVVAETVREMGGDSRLGPLASLLCRIGGPNGVRTVQNSLAPPQPARRNRGRRPGPERGAKDRFEDAATCRRGVPKIGAAVGRLGRHRCEIAGR